MTYFWFLAGLVAFGEAKLNVFVFDIVFGTESDVSLAMSFGLAVFLMFIAHEAVSTTSYSRLGQFATQTWSVATVAAWTAGVSLLLFAIAALGRRARKAPAIPA